MCSTILMPNDTIINNINETMNVSNMTILPGVSTSGKDRTLEQMLESLDLSRVKKAGPFPKIVKFFFPVFPTLKQNFLTKLSALPTATG